MKASKSDESGENGDATAGDDDEENGEGDEDMDLGGGGREPSTSTGGTSSGQRRRKREAIGGESSNSSTAAAAVGRDESGDGPPASKRPKKTPCKYGAKCYQTGARHREQFDHPWDVGGVHKVECANIKVENVSSTIDMNSLLPSLIQSLCFCASTCFRVYVVLVLY